MQIKRAFCLLGLLLIWAISGGCAISNVETVSPIHQVSPTLSDVNTSPTTIATHTLTRVATLIPTHIPTPPLTMSFVPTLSIEEARIRLLDLLADNGSCRLPCIWGITLGESTFKEAQNILTPLSGTSNFTDLRPGGPGTITPFFIEDDLIINTTVIFISYPDNDMISHIHFDAGAFKEVPDPTNSNRSYQAFIFDSTSFGKKLAFYMLPNLLSEYGRPSSVLLRTNPGPNERGGMGLFTLILMYPDQGFLVQYTTIMRMSGANVLGCPANAHVTVDLYPSGHADTFIELIAPVWNDIISVYKPLEEVTSMSVEQFYQTFRQPTDKCLVTPSTHWPEPER